MHALIPLSLVYVGALEVFSNEIVVKAINY